MTVEIEQDISRVALRDGFPGAGPDAAEPDRAAGVGGLLRAKELMLSLEWDIAPGTLRQLDGEIGLLEGRVAADKTVVGLLRILRALGRYLLQAGNAAHPAAGRLFFAVYNGVEKAMLTAVTDPQRKKRILFAAMQKYNLVRGLIDQAKPTVAKSGAGGEGTAGPAANGAGENSGVTSLARNGDKPATQEERPGGPTDVFADLLRERPANAGDELLTDIHLSVFKETAGDGPAAAAPLLSATPDADAPAGGFKETTVAPALAFAGEAAGGGEAPPVVGLDAGSDHDVETELEKKLASFFEEKPGGGVTPSPEPSAAVAGFEEALQGALENVFGDGDREGREAEGVVPLANAAPPGRGIPGPGETAVLTQWTMLLDRFVEEFDGDQTAGWAELIARVSPLAGDGNPGAAYLGLFLDRFASARSQLDGEGRRRGICFFALCRKRLPEILFERRESRAAMLAVAREFFSMGSLVQPAAAGGCEDETGEFEAMDLFRSSRQRRTGAARKSQSEFVIEDVQIP